MKNQWVLFFLCSLFIFVLIYTASSKLFNFSHYVNSMQSQPISKWVSTTLTYLIPVAEVVLAYCIYNKDLRSIGLLGTTFLLFAFTGYVAYINISGLYSTTCPCGGLFSNLNWIQHLYVNSILTVLSFFTYFYYKKW
jgi:uncharacterized membrane protein YhaH (DUF805 family)